MAGDLLTPDPKRLVAIDRLEMPPTPPGVIQSTGYSAALSSDQQTISDTIAQVYRGTSVVRHSPLPPSANAAANAAANSSAIQIVSQIPTPTTTGGGITSAGLIMPPQYGVAGSPITPPSGTEIVTWNLETPGNALGVPLASASVGGTWDTSAATGGLGSVASVTGTPSSAGESALFFVVTAGSTQPSAPVPSGGGWSAIDNSAAAYSIYTQSGLPAGSFTASAPITSNTWSGLLAFFGGGPFALVQKNAITSGGFSGQPTGSAKFSHAFTSNITAGNIIYVLLEVGSAGSNPLASISATDTRGTVYSPIGGIPVGGGGGDFAQISVFAGIALTSGSCTVTVTLNLTPVGTTIGATAIVAYEVSGPSVVSALPRFVPVDTILGAVNLNAQGPGGVEGILPLFNGGTSADLSATGGTSQVLTQSSVGGVIAVRQLDYPDLTGTVAAPTYLTRTTAAAGLVAELATQNLTAQAANKALTTLYANALAGLYRVSVYIIISQAATISSTLPDTQIVYVDRDSGATITVAATATSAGNTTSTFMTATVVINPTFNSTIQFAIGQSVSYASAGATPMQFAYRARLEYLG